MAVSMSQALAWRLYRHYLNAGAGAGSVSEVVQRLGAVPAWSGEPDLAVQRRLTRPRPGAIADALDNGDLIRTYAFRGATHLMTAEDAGVYLAVRGASRQWELPSWQKHYDLRVQDWPVLRETVREALSDGPVSRVELIDAITAKSRFRHLRQGLGDRSHTLLKAFAWQGDLCFGPLRDGQPTYQSPDVSPHWKGLPDLDNAGRRAVLAYLAGYGPATRANLHHWLVAGLSAGRRRLDGWLLELADDANVVEVVIDGHPMIHLRKHLESLALTEPTSAEVTLLPGYDQWVLGPGTDDNRVVPPAHRSSVTRGANLVLQSGVVAGTWKVHRGTLAVNWSAEAGGPRKAMIELEGERLAKLLERDLVLTVTVA